MQNSPEATPHPTAIDEQAYHSYEIGLHLGAWFLEPNLPVDVYTLALNSAGEAYAQISPGVIQAIANLGKGRRLVIMNEEFESNLVGNRFAVDAEGYILMLPSPGADEWEREGHLRLNVPAYSAMHAAQESAGPRQVVSLDTSLLNGPEAEVGYSDQSHVAGDIG